MVLGPTTHSLTHKRANLLCHWHTAIFSAEKMGVTLILRDYFSSYRALSPHARIDTQADSISTVLNNGENWASSRRNNSMLSRLVRAAKILQEGKPRARRKRRNAYTIYILCTTYLLVTRILIINPCTDLHHGKPDHDTPLPHISPGMKGEPRTKKFWCQVFRAKHARIETVYGTVG